MDASIYFVLVERRRVGVGSSDVIVFESADGLLRLLPDFVRVVSRVCNKAVTAEISLDWYCFHQWSHGCRVIDVVVDQTHFISGVCIHWIVLVIWVVLRCVSSLVVHLLFEADLKGDLIVLTILFLILILVTFNYFELFCRVNLSETLSSKVKWHRLVDHSQILWSRTYFVVNLGSLQNVLSVLQASLYVEILTILLLMMPIRLRWLLLILVQQVNEYRPVHQIIDIYFGRLPLKLPDWVELIR